MKIVVADMVLRNANLTNEITVLRRILGQYELATSQDLFSILNWFVGQLNGPLERLEKEEEEQQHPVGTGTQLQPQTPAGHIEARWFQPPLSTTSHFAATQAPFGRGQTPGKP